MSLKAFHIFFISVSILLAFGFGVWEVVGYFDGGETGQLLVAFVSFAGGVGLIFYAIRFLRKLKHVSYI